MLLLLLLCVVLPSFGSLPFWFSCLLSRIHFCALIALLALNYIDVWRGEYEKL